ncbi:MAG: hypothetical protein ACD_21C00106G0007 [uncultured bacterium]|nr:MAG: hypothetical protein ACD_21C00106G0007 [uncultured bacterium]
MNKIQRVSLFLRVIFQIAMVAWPIWLITYWSFAPHFIPDYLGTIRFVPENIEILHPITKTDAFWGFTIGLLPLAVTMTVLYFLVELFKLYEQGKIFTTLNVKYIRNIGITMLIGQIVNIIYDALITFALTFHNPAGHKYASVTFGGPDAYNIIIAIMIVVISWIMAEGCKLHEENQYVV